MRLSLIIEQIKASESVIEELKAADQMAWVGAMNGTRNRAEEITLRELIYGEDAVSESLKNFGTAILSQRSTILLLVRSTRNYWS